MRQRDYKSLYKSVSLSSISKYLECNGWEIDNSCQNKNVIVFGSEDGCTIVLPSRESFIDFYPKIVDAINTLSVLENRDVDDILNDIINLDVDILELRIVSEFAKKGSIPLKFAADFVSGIKNLVISSACTEENPRPYYINPTQSSLSYGDIFRFGQTNIGSFIITIESSPIIGDCGLQIKVNDDCTLSEDIPFQRRIMRRIQKALYQVEHFSDHANIDEFIKTAFEDGINANMCDAILDLKTVDESVTIESCFKLSKLVRSCDNIPERIVLSNNSFHIIEAISKAYRDIRKTEEVTIEGKIRSLTVGNIANSENVNGYVTIQFEYEGKKRNVKTYLEGDDYKVACDAHKDQRKITVKGILDKTSKSWYLDLPRNFRIVSNYEAQNSLQR